MHVRCDNCGTPCKAEDRGASRFAIDEVVGECRACGHVVRFRAGHPSSSTPSFGAAPPRAHFLRERPDVTPGGTRLWPEVIDLTEEDVLYGAERTRVEWGPLPALGPTGGEAQVAEAVPREVVREERTQREAVLPPLPAPPPAAPASSRSIPDSFPQLLIDSDLEPSEPSPTLVVLPAVWRLVPDVEQPDLGGPPSSALAAAVTGPARRPWSPAGAIAAAAVVLLSVSGLLVASRRAALPAPPGPAPAEVVPAAAVPREATAPAAPAAKSARSAVTRYPPLRWPGDRPATVYPPLRWKR